MNPDILYLGFVLGHGGDAVQMLDLAAGMANRGRRVRVIVPRIPTTIEFAQHGIDRGIEVVRSPLIRADPVAPKQVPADLIQLFEENPASLIHLHTGDFCLSRTVPRVMGELNIPPDKVVVTVHSPYDTLTPGDERSTAWSHAAGRRIRTIVCPSQHALQTQLKYGVPAANLCHIPNGVHLAKFRSGDGTRVRTELGLQADDPLLVGTSRLDDQKRPQDALEGFIRIASDFPTCRLAFVGAGSLRGVLQDRADAADLADRVYFAGQRADIPDWLAAATIWMLPTESENFSIAVLEALAAGCPILSTLCKGNDEVLEPGKNAEIHRIGDVDQLTDRLRAMLTSSELRTSLSKNAIQTSHRYDVNVMVDRYLACYEAGR